MGYSVAMCTYNGEKYIKQQIDSILEQTIKPNEIVVCDDGSTDKTKDILDNYKEKYPDIFRIYYNKENLRSVKNFEKAISLCTQDFIFLSDQDDVWIENKAEIMLKYFEDNPNIDALGTNGYCIDENDCVNTEKYSYWDIPAFLREHNIPVDYYEIITCAGNIFTGASMAFRSKIKLYIFPFPIIKGYYHDEWIATLSSERGALDMLDDKLFYYRIHNEQQVGGVFFDKTEKTKENLTYIFVNILHPKNRSFKTYKRGLKLLSGNYSKQKQMGNEESAQYLKERFYLLKKECSAKFPLKSKILFIVDKIFKKRQI